MVRSGTYICPECGGRLLYYDRVKRRVISERRTSKWIFIDRFRCINCKKTHRTIPACIFPFKHYRADIIVGVIEGRITPYILEYEDYPCEATMNRWAREIFNPFYAKM